VSLAALTVVSGIVDAVSLLGLGHVFTANMTGNVALVGFGIAGAPGFSVTASLCALGCFVGGAVVGGRIAQRVPRHRSLMLVVMTVEASLTVAAAVIAASQAVIGSGWPRYTLIALLAFAMGTRNSAVRSLGVPDMTKTVLTTTLTGFASESTLAGGRNPNAAHRATSVLCMFGGALVGALLIQHINAASALGIAAAILVTTWAYFYRAVPLELGMA
jgi:uncharacterized membrane protein YoaK (UPF0700 family)